jgi:hypothetical protein
MQKSESIKNLTLALAKAQAEMPAVKFDSVNPFLKNKYATLGAVIDTLKPVLAKYELGYIQSPVSDHTAIGVSTMIFHSSGEWIEDSIYIPVRDQKGLSDAQVAGVAISYLRRYSLVSFFGMYADQDNDGTFDGEKPAKVLDKKPSPEPKVTKGASSDQQLKTDFGLKYYEAKNMGIEGLPTIKGDSTPEFIKEKMAEIEALIANKKTGE